MSKSKETEDSSSLLPVDKLDDVYEFDDELNDETFGDALGEDGQDDWESAQDFYNDKVDFCLEQLKKVLGDRIPDIELKIVASKSNYDFELALRNIIEDEQYQLQDLLSQSSSNEQSKQSNQLKHNTAINGTADHDSEKHDLSKIESMLFNDAVQHEEESKKVNLNEMEALQKLYQIQLMQNFQQMNNQQAHSMINPAQFDVSHLAQLNNLQSYQYLNPQAPPQFLPPHIQQLLFQQQQQLLQRQHYQAQAQAQCALNESTLSDSFASINLNATFPHHLPNHNVLDQNALANRARNENHQTSDFFDIKSQSHIDKNGQYANGETSKKSDSIPSKRPLTLEEIEQGMQEDKCEIESQSRPSENKQMTLQDLENSFLNNAHKQVTPEKQSVNNFGFNINNLNDFPVLDGEFRKVDKTTPVNEMRSSSSQSTSHSFNHHQQSQNHYPQNASRFNQNNRQNHNQNYNHHNNRDRNSGCLTRDYHSSLIPNPLNPLELIRNDSFDNNRSSYNNSNNNNKQRSMYQQNNNQQNRNYNHHQQQNRGNYNNNFATNRSDDEYAGIMTPKDINWLRRIQHMQLEFDDPYVQDFYFINYQTRKIAAELKKRDKMNGETHDAPQLIIPERRLYTRENLPDGTPRYVPPDFSGSLGKIQVANVNYPRKLLDLSSKLEKLASKSEGVTIEPAGRTELNKFRRLLLNIERNLTYVLKIDHEDKKIAALPPDAQVTRLEERKRLSDELFNGILTTDDCKNVNFNIANIRKGCMLIFKALQVIRDPYQKTVIICDLLNVENFHYVVMQKDKTLYCLDYGQVLIDAIKTIKDCDFSLLLKIAHGLDDASVIAKFQCGQEIIETLLVQYTYFNVTDKNQKLSWLSFLERVLEDVDDIPHLRKMCNDHIVALTGQE